MSEITVFRHQDFGQIRTVLQGGAPWFVAADVCRALGLEQVSRAMDRLDPDERGLLKVTHPQSPGKTLEVNGVSEPGLYHLALCSSKPEAKAFKRWITHEVLPAIRQQGFYGTEAAVERMLGDPAAAIQMLQAYQLERSQRRLLEAQAAQDAPKVLFADSVAASHQSILIGELAKLMKQNGVEVGQNRLFEWLRRDGYLLKYGESRNMPSQYSMENGWLEIKERAIHNPDGSVRLTRTPKVTGRGQQYFINRYLKQ
ncbi:MAG: phage antirepressor Ant [Clostridiales bacterium]|nr:phage antirepressor Ant [Clostridiales bacterium]